MRNNTKRLRDHRIDGVIYTRYFFCVTYPYVLPSL
jgi:hypothetical protein